MNAAVRPESNYGFTKIVVGDLERTAAFYAAVFDYREFQRVQSDVAGEPIEEIIMVRGAGMEGEVSLVVWKWPLRRAPRDSDVILGFVTSDVDAVVARAPAAGGKVIQPPRDQPEHGVRVGFIADVDGRLIEVVQVLGAPQAQT
jgi:predicted enzyme related to lactoylglutathione lyase